MEFLEWIVDDSEIVGIGPLMKRDSIDPVDRSLYGSVQLFFSLVLRHQVVEIKSQWFERTGIGPSTELKHKALFKDFQDGYKNLAFKVAALFEAKGANKL